MKRLRDAIAASALLAYCASAADGSLDLRPAAPVDRTRALVASADQVGRMIPMIVAGDPLGIPPDSPALRVDANSALSPLAGVGSLFIDAAPVGDNVGFLCSSCAIHGFTVGNRQVRDYVLTAAHCLDFAGGLDPFDGATGDGVADVAPQDVTFLLNFGGNLTHAIAATEIHLHPDWHGFLNVLGPDLGSFHDDIALVRLASPLPAGVPVYNPATIDSGNVEVVTSVGYGRSGDPSGFNVPASFTIKRAGLNQADAVVPDDEGGGPFEMFLADFDGPTALTNLFDIGSIGFDAFLEGTLGNTLESTIGPGDSGGPSFLSDFFTGDLLTGDDGELIVFGLNTFSSVDAPAYGSLYGGMMLSAYAEWLDSVMVPEPASWSLLVLGLPAMVLGRRPRHGP